MSPPTSGLPPEVSQKTPTTSGSCNSWSSCGEVFRCLEVELKELSVLARKMDSNVQHMSERQAELHNAVEQLQHALYGNGDGTMGIRGKILDTEHKIIDLQKEVESLKNVHSWTFKLLVVPFISLVSLGILIVLFKLLFASGTIDMLHRGMP